MTHPELPAVPDRPTRELVDAALGRYLAEGDRAAQWDRPTLRRELWAVLDRDPQSDRDLVETVRNLAALAARTPLPAEPSTGDLLRAAAAGRREYAGRGDVPGADDLLAEAATLECAAQVADGDMRPLYGWLPSWRWTPEMEQRVLSRTSASTSPADVAGAVLAAPLPAEPSIAERARAMGVTRRPLVDVLIEAGVPSAPLPAVPDGEEAAVDEMEGHFIDANERMGEALVAIGMALGLPRPCVGATWGAPEILARIAQWNGSLGSCYDHSILGHDDARVAAPVVGCSDCLDALTTPLPAGEDVPARLDAAGWALHSLGGDVAYSAMGDFWDAAAKLRDGTPEVRAAVAAALARLTGGDAATP